MNPIKDIKNAMAAMPNPVELARDAKRANSLMEKQLEHLIKQTQLFETWTKTAIIQAEEFEKMNRSFERIAKALEKKI